jgi:ClpP class serine protease
MHLQEYQERTQENNMSKEILAIMKGYDGDFFQAHDDVLAYEASGNDAPESCLLTVYENVGIISASGMLTNRDSEYNRWAGLVSYNELKQAALEAIEEYGVKSLVYDWNSPGGHVSGMRGHSDFVRSLDIPTFSHSSSTTASAALFQAISTDTFHIDDLTTVGSVGVVRIVASRARMLKEAGYDVKVIKSGAKKMAGNEYEPLSKENETYIQAQVMYMANKFYDFVSEMRGLQLTGLSEIKSGRTFIGEQAVSIGLVDGIADFNQVMAAAMVAAQKVLDSANDQYSHR